MKILVDNALSPTVAAKLRAAGYDAVHLRAYGLQAAPDEEVLALAAKERRILVSADTDFGALLALSEETEPSFILLRGAVSRVPVKQVTAILAILRNLASALESGSIIVFDGSRVRVRALPIAGKGEAGG